ncbi:MAG: sigma-70 family RNA polymerase sigma factor [Litorilinea sp.]
MSRFFGSDATTAVAAVAAAEMTDVIHAARLGDEYAFAVLIEQYQATAQRLAQHILRTEEAAADAVQDALIKVHRALPRFHDGNFRSWLLRIVTNTCYDHLRSQKRRASVSLDEINEQAGNDLPLTDEKVEDDPESIILQREGFSGLMSAIEELPDWHRSVVVLVDVKGYDYQEAADILELPLGTIKSRLSRARATLRDRLIENGFVAQYREN